jgi:multiple sugar transport system permease protein
MTLIMYLNQHLKAKNYGMAGALSVYLFVISAILCAIVYKMMQDNDTDGSIAAARKARKEAKKAAKGGAA